MSVISSLFLRFMRALQRVLNTVANFLNCGYWAVKWFFTAELITNTIKTAPEQIYSRIVIIKCICTNLLSILITTYNLSSSVSDFHFFQYSKKCTLAELHCLALWHLDFEWKTWTSTFWQFCRKLWRRQRFLQMIRSQRWASASHCAGKEYDPARSSPR